MIVSRAVFQAFGPQDTAAFIGSEEHAALDEFARALPLAVQAHGLEFKLADGAEHADYLVCLEAEPDCVVSVRAWLERAREPLARVGQFLARWASQDDSAVRTEFPILWLEWDRPRGLVPDAPALFVAPRAAIQQERARGELARAFDLLYGAELGVRQQRALACVASALPPGARIRHLGAMPSRHPALLRVVLEGVRPDALSALLLQLRWPGDHALLTQLLSEIEASAGAVPARVDLDCVDRPTGSLGLEFLLSGDCKPADNGAALVAYLQQRGWCGEAKAAALRRWLNWSRVAWPEIAPHSFWQKLYHLKLTLKDDGERARRQTVTAKGYWGAWAGPGERTLSQVHAAFKQALLGDVA